MLTIAREALSKMLTFISYKGVSHWGIWREAQKLVL